MADIAPAETDGKFALRDGDLLRVLVALAGRIAFPPEKLFSIVSAYANAYNMCTGELTIASLSRASGIDKSNLRKALLRWEQAGVIFRIGPEGRPLHLYPLALPADQNRGKTRGAHTASEAPEAAVDGGVDGQEER